jgi:glycosyltransferase involved in cell wall biosynthesis
MPGITALLHTHNDALRLGRALEILYSCDEILIVDHDSRDATVQIAHEYGARVIGARTIEAPIIEAQSGGSLDQYLDSVRQPWILCLDPRESISESLVATLFEWKSQPASSLQNSAPAFSLRIREETAQGWTMHPTPHTRLVPRSWRRWEGAFPAPESSAPTLEGEILRFVFP